MGKTPGELVHLMHVEMQSNTKKAKFSIPWLGLPVRAELKEMLVGP